MFDNLLHLLSCADEQGFLTVTVHDYDHDKKIPRAERLANLMQSAVGYDHQLLTLYCLRKKSALKTIDLTAERHADKQHWTLRFNLAKVLLLPAENPAQEIDEFVRFIELVKELMTAAGPVDSNVQICNNRDRNKRVYGSIAFKLVEKNMAHESEAPTKALNKVVDESPVLSIWLRNVALALQRLGPWSWSTIRQDSIFGYMQGPWSLEIRRQSKEEFLAAKDAA